MSLPPGQHAIGSFPRFGVHSSGPPPPISEPAAIRVEGAIARRLEVPVSRLAGLERRAIVADFHCVAGWTARDLHWCGVSFRTFYESVIVPEAQPEPGVSHITFQGADGYHSTLTLEDALEKDVLLADQLGETALSGGHGAPVRLVSPKQYGYKNTKHLCRIELRTRAQADGHERAVANFLLALLGPHPRARVAEEERHRYLPAWVLRKIYWKLYRSLAGAAQRRARAHSPRRGAGLGGAMDQPTCCKKPSWASELDLDHAGGFEYALGKCARCGAYSMNVFCVASGITGFETVRPSDVERMKSIPAGPERKEWMREWGARNL